MLRRMTVAALLAATFAPSAHAAGPAFGIRALVHSKLGYFVYAAKPGTHVTGKAQITNSGDRVGTVKLFAADATTGQTSGAVYLTSGEKRHDVGAWVRLPAKQLELIRRCARVAMAVQRSCYEWLGRTLAVITNGAFRVRGCTKLESSGRRACIAGAARMNAALVTFS